MTKNDERVIVMRAGRIVEVGKTLSIMQAPAHPYTRFSDTRVTVSKIQ